MKSAVKRQKKVGFYCRMEEDLKAEIDRRCAESGMSIGDLVNKTLRAHVHATALAETEARAAAVRESAQAHARPAKS